MTTKLFPSRVKTDKDYAEDVDRRMEGKNKRFLPGKEVREVGKAKLELRTTGPMGDIAEQVMEARAEAFLECLKEGMSKSEAAEAVGADLAELKRDPAVMEAAKSLIRRYRFSAAERKELARAKLNQIMLEGEDKVALQAVKLIGEDVEVGLTVHGGPQVNVAVGVFSQDAAQVLDKATGEMEGWGEVIDAQAVPEDGNAN